MNQERTISDMAFSIIGSILEDPLWVIVRLVPWLFVAIAAPKWLAAVLLCGILLGPYLFDPVVGALHQVRWGFDAALFLLGWVSMHTVFGSWIAASVIMAVYLGFFYWKSDLVTKRPKGPTLSIFKASDTTIDPTIFANRIVTLTDQVLARHGWTQRDVLRNNTELKRYQYKARLDPSGLVEIICFDDGFPGNATYPFPLLGNVDISLDLPGTSTTTVATVFEDIYAEAQAVFPGVRQLVVEQAKIGPSASKRQDGSLPPTAPRREPWFRMRTSCREGNLDVIKRCLFIAITALLVLSLPACGGGSARSAQAYCDTVAKHRDRYLSAMDTANGSGGLGGLLGGIAAIGDIKTMWVDLAKVAPDEIQTDTEAVRDAWKATEDAAKSGDFIGAITNSIINTSASERVNNYIVDNGGADYAPM